jgi:hypothetical protein
MSTAIGSIIKKRRQGLGLKQTDLVARLKAHGVDLPRTTLRGWEADPARKWDYDWNPDFLRALAESLETSDLAILHEMGFPVIPEGYTLEDMLLAQRIREAPPTQRKEIVRAMLAILDDLGVE